MTFPKQDDLDYRRTQLANVLTQSTEDSHYTIKISADHSHTKYLNITRDELLKITKVLLHEQGKK